MWRYFPIFSQSPSDRLPDEKFGIFGQKGTGGKERLPIGLLFVAQGVDNRCAAEPEVGGVAPGGNLWEELR